MEHYRLITESINVWSETFELLTEIKSALEQEFKGNGFFFLSVPDANHNALLGGFLIGDDTSIGDTNVAAIFGDEIKYTLYDAHTAELIYKNHE